MAAVDTLNVAFWSALGDVAANLGRDCAFYRPKSTGNAISQANYLSNAVAAFDADPTLKKQRPLFPGKPIYGAFNAINSQAGDYIVGPQGTLFIASIQDIIAPVLYRCNRVLSFYRPSSGANSAVYGDDYVAGNTVNNNDGVLLALNFPASVRKGSKGEKADDDLPTDARQPWFTIFIPRIPGVELQTDDIATDDLGNRYQLSSVIDDELGMGVEISAREANV